MGMTHERISMVSRPPAGRFTEEDSNLAYDEWKANCGPGAIAAVCGLTLDEVRPHLGDFERKGYTNPKLMWEILDRLGVKWKKIMRPQSWPSYGLARVQWHGPWTEPGVSPQAAYRHTHWVGAMSNSCGTSIFDINALSIGSGWCSVGDWAGLLVPHILRHCEPKASAQGGRRWSLTHAVEVEMPITAV